MRKPTRGPEQRAIDHGVGVRQRFLGLRQLRRLRDGETRSPWAAAGAGVGLSRSRHRLPTRWIIERSPVPADERSVAKAAEADVEQHTCGAEVTSCSRTASLGRPKRSRRDRSDEGWDRRTQREGSPAAVDGGVVTALGRRGALRGESVEGCPVFLGGNFEIHLHIIGDVPAGTPVGGDARDQDVCRVSVIDIVGQRLGFDGALAHPTIVPSTCSLFRLPRDGHQQGRSRPAQPPAGSALTPYGRSLVKPFA
jgi:hypothetical protein